MDRFSLSFVCVKSTAFLQAIENHPIACHFPIRLLLEKATHPLYKLQDKSLYFLIFGSGAVTERMK